MTMTTFETAPATFDPAAPLRRLWADAPVMTMTGLMLAALMVPTLAAMALDGRTIEGVNVWVKPFKFELALVLYTLTLAFFARWLTPGGRLFRAYMLIVAAAITYEILWIGGASMFGTTSHFNQAPGMAGLYALAGIGAVTLTSASLVMGLRFRRAPTGLAAPLHLSIWLGLVMTFVLTLPVAGFMASGTGHFVGTSTAPGLFLMGWSRDAGDLRVAHFFATHAMHFLPLLGLAAATLPRGRTLVWAGAGAWTLLVALTFAQALAGKPFLPFLG